MARTTVQIVGDEASLMVHAINLTGPTAVDFESGSFAGSGEEIRLVNIILSIGAKIFKLRCKWIDAAFTRTTIIGTLRPRGNI